MKNAPIGIVGGGIGGVAGALALHRVGIRAVVYERAPVMLEVGAGMMLWPNATRVLRELDLLDGILARSGSTTKFLVRASSGAILMNIALGRFDVPALCTRRSDLLAALLRALPPENIRLGYELERIETTNRGVRLHFVNGEAHQHDAVVGADGIRSRVRAHLFDGPHPIYRGYAVWRGMATYRGDAVPTDSNSETWGSGKRFGILEMDDGAFTWYATANVPEEHPEAADGRRRELLKMFQGWHKPVSQLIAATETILRNGAYDLPPLRRWSSGAITLLGDAAHPCTPNLGQGGCLALEDALVLARCVKSEPSFEGAFARYESLRRSRTRHIQQRSHLMGSIGQWESRIVVKGRRFITSLLPSLPFERNLRRVYSYEA